MFLCNVYCILFVSEEELSYLTDLSSNNKKKIEKILGSQFSQSEEPGIGDIYPEVGGNPISISLIL